MVFYWKMWLRFFVPLYAGSHVLLILLLLFDLGVLQHIPPSEAMRIGGCGLGAVQGLLLLWSGGGATVLSTQMLEEKKIRLFWNSLGISTRSILGWCFVPLGITSLMMAFWFNVASPLSSRCKEERIQSFVPVNVPFSTGQFAVWIRKNQEDGVERVQIRSKQMRLEASRGNWSGSHVTLYDGTGTIDDWSFSYSALSVPVNKSVSSRSLHSQSNRELWSNGGRREQMEVIQRLVLPVAFPFVMTGLNVLVQRHRKPMGLLMAATLMLWGCIRLTELSTLPAVWAGLPLLLSVVFCMWAWGQVQ